jgi:hypothetical protein
MKVSKLLVGIPALLCAMLFVSNAFADVVTVANPSFETLPAGGLPYGSCGAGCSFSEITSTDGIPGWTTSATGFIGQFQPGSSSGNFAWFNYVPDGTTVAYSDIAGSTIYQQVGPVLNGETYTLQVDIGARNDTGVNSFLGSADLMLGSIVCPAIGTPPSPGNWSVYTATCTDTSWSPTDNITIQLNTSLPPYPIVGQGDFDNVGLTDNLSTSPIPEPSSLTLFGSGLLAMAYLLRRKRVAQS